jgi:AraC-like DNA-binding protein
MGAMENTSDYRALLASEMMHRKSRNSAYSLRAYARDLGISPSRLSEVLGRLLRP